MKYVLIIPDGVADEPQAALNNQTPLQAAQLPSMDEVALRGRVGATDNVPASMPSGSDVGTMSLFGYDTLKYHTGRAPIEAAAQGIELSEGDWAIRCNLVTVEQGVMKSFTAEQYPSDGAAELIQLLQKNQCGGQEWKFHAGVSYRNLLIFRSRGGQAPFSASTHTTPPHDITDQAIAGFLPLGPGGEQLQELMNVSEQLFADAPANVRRRRAGESPATQVWLWGQGSRPALTRFEEKFNVRGAVITAVDLLRGMGRLIGWEVIEVEGATGYLDTDYAAKGRAAIAALQRDDIDFVVVHVEATDEASHEGDTAAKVEAVEQIDSKIVGPVHEYLKEQGEYRLLVCPDHPTFLRTRTHSHGDCPFAMCGTGITPDTAARYDEVVAAASDLRFAEGHNLMQAFLHADRG
ncbi:MAG: cofactor-independent phosphoglycerate mutase [Planctomycetaceae bacterium]|nr:cofactor-independent phosphoglycerate mutase [Planctomycetaceae bacterium]